MHSAVRVRFWVETVLASSCGLLALLTLVRRDWIEALAGFDPDRHSGSVEWVIVACLFAASLLAGRAARTEWRRPRPALVTGT